MYCPLSILFSLLFFSLYLSEISCSFSLTSLFFSPSLVLLTFFSIPYIFSITLMSKYAAVSNVMTKVIVLGFNFHPHISRQCSFLMLGLISCSLALWCFLPSFPTQENVCSLIVTFLYIGHNNVIYRYIQCNRGCQVRFGRRSFVVRNVCKLVTCNIRKQNKVFSP